MRSEQMNRVSGTALVVLSLAALLEVLVGVVSAALNGPPPPQRDEGAAAHVFQLLLAGLVAMGMLSLATADWTRPRHCARRLVLPTAAVVAALGILLSFENYAR